MRGLSADAPVIPVVRVLAQFLVNMATGNAHALATIWRLHMIGEISPDLSPSDDPNDNVKANGGDPITFTQVSDSPDGTSTPSDTAVRLLASPDDGTVLVACVLVLNCCSASATRAFDPCADLVATAPGRALVEVLLSVYDACTAGADNEQTPTSVETVDVLCVRG